MAVSLRAPHAIEGLAEKRILSGPVDIFGVFCRLFTYTWLVVILFPLLWIVSLSLRLPNEVFQSRFFLIPLHWTVTNYPRAVAYVEEYIISFPLMFRNSGIVTAVALLITVCCSLAASFAFATMRFRLKRLLFYVLMIGLIVPSAVIFIPLVVLVRSLHLLNTFWSLIFPYSALGIPLSTLILTAFFKNLPQEIYDAAKIDGCSTINLFLRIGVPLSKPAIATCVIFLFLQFWNEFPLALVLVQDKSIMTIPLAMSLIPGKAYNPWEILASALLLTSIPVVLIFIIFQKRIIQGLAEGALKG